MEFILAKIYLFIVLGILIISAVFIILQIQLRQNLEKTLIKIQPNLTSYETDFKVGQIYLRKKAYERAIEEFRSCIFNWNKNDNLGMASLFNTLGFTYYQLEEYRMAIYYYYIALNITPNHFTSLTNLIYVYKNQNQIEKLEELNKKLSSLNLNNSKIEEIRSYINRRQGFL